MLPLKVVEDRTGRNNIFEEGSQNGNVPLAVAKLVDQTVLGFYRRDLKSLIKGPVRGSHAQGGIENQQRLAHRIHDVLRVGFNGFEVRLGTTPFRDVLHRQYQKLGVAARSQLPTIAQHHPTSDNREGVLPLKVVKDRTGGNDVFQKCSQSGDVPLAVP